jgi:hypothetical protein
VTTAAGSARLLWRGLPRSVRAASRLLDWYGMLDGFAAIMLALVAVVAAVRGEVMAAAVAAVSVALAVSAVLHLWAGPRVAAGLASWWLVGLALALAHGLASYVDGTYFGRGVSALRTFVLPGLLAAALLWPATVRHVFAAPRAITDLPDEELGRASSGG